MRMSAPLHRALNRQAEAQARAARRAAVAKLESPSRSVPVGRSGIGVVDDTAAATRKLCDLVHFRSRKLKIENCQVLRETLDSARARNDGDTLLHQETETYLRCRLPMRLAD